MKQFILSCVFVVFSGLSVYSQEVNTEAKETKTENLADTIAALQKTLEGKEKELDKQKSAIEKLEQELNKWKTDYKRTDSLLNVEKKEGKSTLMKKQIKNLQKDSIRLTQRIQFVADSLIELHRGEVKGLCEHMAEDSIQLVKLNKELKELEEFKIKWLTELAESVNETWLNKTYSAIQLPQLEVAYAQYEKYADADPKVSEARDLLKHLLENCRLYSQGIEAVNTSYDSAKVESLVRPMRELRDATTNPEKKKELEILTQQLFDYQITVEIFQEVMDAVGSEIKKLEPTEHKIALPIVKATLKKKEDDEGYISAIQNIPWLNGEFEKYKKSLEEDCLNPYQPTLIKK